MKKILIIMIIIIIIIIIMIIIIITIYKVLLTWCKIGNGEMKPKMLKSQEYRNCHQPLSQE